MIGPGGSGKTSLAVEAARAVSSQKGQDAVHGVYFVDLAPVTDPAHVPTAVAAALGLRGGPGGAAGTTPPEAQLEDFLRANHSRLLILDNCEHLLEAVAHLTHRLLRAAADARILATSREPSGSPARSPGPSPAWPSPIRPCQPTSCRAMTPSASSASGPPLPGPSSAWTSRPARWSPTSAAAWTASPGHRAGRGQEPDPAGPGDRQTTGRPLPPPDHRHPTPIRRQQTLQAAIDWSYDLLTEPERLLLARLSVFAASWDLEAAEAICGDQHFPADQILALVSRLVDRSLLQPELGAAARYRCWKPSGPTPPSASRRPASMGSSEAPHRLLPAPG